MTRHPHGEVVDLLEWCPTCHRRLDQPSPDARHGDELIHLDRTTGRWQHTLCLTVTRRNTTKEATTTTVQPAHQS